jgi:hypothetical protein
MTLQCSGGLVVVFILIVLKLLPFLLLLLAQPLKSSPERLMLGVLGIRDYGKSHLMFATGADPLMLANAMKRQDRAAGNAVPITSASSVGPWIAAHASGGISE